MDLDEYDQPIGTSQSVDDRVRSARPANNRGSSSPPPPPPPSHIARLIQRTTESKSEVERCLPLWEGSVRAPVGCGVARAEINFFTMGIEQEAWCIPS
jgi:hypothetical protein